MLSAQAGYYVATGVLPFVSRRAFEAMTGRKREWWLVQTVGALVTVVGIALVAGARSGRVTPELRAIAAGSAASLAAIDVIYVAKRQIAPTYLADAAVIWACSVVSFGVLLTLGFADRSAVACVRARVGWSPTWCLVHGLLCAEAAHPAAHGVSVSSPGRARTVR